MSCNRTARCFGSSYFRHDSRIKLKFSVQFQLRSKFLGNLCSFYDFVHIRMLCTSLCRMESIANDRSCPVSVRNDSAKKLQYLQVSPDPDSAQAPASPKMNVPFVAHITVRYYHKEESGYKLCSRLCLQDLKARAQRICCRMACSGYHTVCIAHFHHHNTIVQISCSEEVLLPALLSCLFLSELYQLRNISLCLVIRCRIHDRRT